MRSALVPALSALLLIACSDATPLLIEIERLEPTALEARDVLSVHGDGFAERTTANLTLDGTVHRAGAPPQSVRVALQVEPESRERARALLDDATIDELLGTDPELEHGTFRGTVRLSFAPLTKGAPPVSGVLPNTVLDVFRRDARDAAATNQDEDTTPTLAQRFGWTLERRLSGGLCVRAIAESGHASPLSVGDCIEAFSGVNVFSERDLVPYPGQRQAEISSVSGRDQGRFSSTVDVSDLRPREAGVWQWVLVFCGMLAAGLVVCRSPLGTALSLIEAKLTARLGARAPRASERQAREQTPSLSGLVPFLAVSALFACGGLGVARTLAEFDVLLVHASGAAALFIAQLLGGGRRLGRWSVGRAFVSAWRGLALQSTIALSISVAVFRNASFSMREVASTQGGLPWEFHAFQSVGAYLSALALLCAIALLGILRFDDAPRTSVSEPPRPRVTQALLDTETWILAGLLVAVYLGGWQVPQAVRLLAPDSEMLGPLVFQLKLTLLFVSVVWLRTIVPRVPERALAPLFWRWLLPLAALAAVLDLIWSSGSWPSWLESASTWTLVACSALCLLGLVARLVVRHRQPALVASVNPWL